MIRKPIRQLLGERRKLCQELVMLEYRLREVGLHHTARLLNKAVQRIGHEACEAEKIERQQELAE